MTSLYDVFKIPICSADIMVVITSLTVRGSPVRYAKFESIRYFIDIDILQNCLIDIDIDIDIFQNHHIDIDIDIDIFQKCRYIDNRYVISIYRTGLATIE